MNDCTWKWWLHLKKNVHAVKAAEHWSRLWNFSPCRGVLKLRWTRPWTASSGGAPLCARVWTWGLPSNLSYCMTMILTKGKLIAQSLLDSYCKPSPLKNFGIWASILSSVPKSQIYGHFCVSVKDLGLYRFIFFSHKGFILVAFLFIMIGYRFRQIV